MEPAIVLQFDRCSNFNNSSNQNNNYTSEFNNHAFRNNQDDLDKVEDCDVSFSQSIKNSTLSSLKQLLKMYKLQVDVESSLEDIPSEYVRSPKSQTVLSGSVQDNIRRSNSKELDQSDCQAEQKECYFSKLPVS